MTEQEKQMEFCSHAWIYDHTEYHTVYLRCPYCNMVRMAMPGEPCQMVRRELNIRRNGEDGDA